MKKLILLALALVFGPSAFAAPILQSPWTTTTDPVVAVGGLGALPRTNGIGTNIYIYQPKFDTIYWTNGNYIITFGTSQMNMGPGNGFTALRWDYSGVGNWRFSNPKDGTLFGQWTPSGLSVSQSLDISGTFTMPILTGILGTDGGGVVQKATLVNLTWDGTTLTSTASGGTPIFNNNQFGSANGFTNIKSGAVFTNTLIYNSGHLAPVVEVASSYTAMYGPSSATSLFLDDSSVAIAGGASPVSVSGSFFTSTTSSNYFSLNVGIGGGVTFSNAASANGRFVKWNGTYSSWTNPAVAGPEYVNIGTTGITNAGMYYGLGVTNSLSGNLGVNGSVYTGGSGSFAGGFQFTNTTSGLACKPDGTDMVLKINGAIVGRWSASASGLVGPLGWGGTDASSPKYYFVDSAGGAVIAFTSSAANRTNLTVKALNAADFVLATNGVASFAQTTAATIAATGWTNIWSTNNATVYVTSTAVSWIIKDRANATLYTSPPLTATTPVNLQPGWSVSAASGLAGTALPW